jgi:hypothetical protein
MLGSNYYGETYYGQGPAVGTTFTLKTVSATVTSSATISFVLLINKTVTATVTATASIAKRFMRTLEASVATSSFPLISRIIKALNIRRASTKSNTPIATTRSLNPVASTKELNLIATTKDITSD